jgi:hypothetical protein
MEPKTNEPPHTEELRLTIALRSKSQVASSTDWHAELPVVFLFEAISGSSDCLNSPAASASRGQE